MRGAIAAVAAVALAGAAAAVVHADGPARVTATDRDGRTVAELELPRSGAFALAYRHSYYRQPAVERFVAADDGSFSLVEIASPSEAVLDYYEIEGAKRRSDGWWHLRPDHPARFTRMALAATAVGRRTLVAGRDREPLFRGDGRVSHLTIAVEGG